MFNITGLCFALDAPRFSFVCEFTCASKHFLVHTQLYTSKVNIGVLSMPTTVHKQHKESTKIQVILSCSCHKECHNQKTWVKLASSKAPKSKSGSILPLKDSNNLSPANDTVKSDFLQVKLIEAWPKVPKGVEFDSHTQPVLSQQLVFLQSSQK